MGEIEDGASLFNFDDGIDLCISQALMHLSPKSYNVKYMGKYQSN